MNVNLYICILAGISIVFFLLNPGEATYGSAVLFDLMKGDLTTTQILEVLGSVALENAGVLLGTAIYMAVLLSIFGASAVLPIVFNVGVFFLIPNLFILPTHLLVSGLSGLPSELTILMIFGMNVLLLMTAIEFWR